MMTAQQHPRRRSLATLPAGMIGGTMDGTDTSVALLALLAGAVLIAIGFALANKAKDEPTGNLIGWTIGCFVVGALAVIAGCASILN